MIAASAVAPRGDARMLVAQVVHSGTGLLRSAAVLVFSFGMPLVWLVLIGLVAGNAEVAPGSGLRVMQYATPSALAMGALFATLPSVAIAVGEAGERGVLTRLRSTPMPGWVYVTGVVTAATLFGAASLVVTLAVARVLYDVRIPDDAVGPFALTSVVALLAFCAVGFAIGAVAPTGRIAELVSIGAAVAMTFVSGVFVVGAALPAWLEAVASALPLKPVVEAYRSQFDPGDGAAGWSPGALAVVGLWALAAVAVAVVAFRRPRHPHATAAGPSRAVPGTADDARPPASIPGRVAVHAGMAVRGLGRRPGDLVFSVGVPLVLFVLLVTVQTGFERPDGVDVPLFTAASMTAWGIAVAAFLTTAEARARARATGVRTRMLGTPARMPELAVGRAVVPVLVGAGLMLVLVGIAATGYGSPVAAAGVAAALAVVVLGVAAFAACGVLLAESFGSVRAVGSAGLLLLFVLAFVSDVFLVMPPEWMRAVGAWFPLAHLQHALVVAFTSGPPADAVVDVLVLVAWGGGAAAIATALGRVRRSRS